ncbi:hypothetical protein PAPYR_1378 [Paratrimastix pyriformis]|uniref:Uncharacterized protein n=1 Tax=Paratrimastix pyriformis TaxID=342808 RepID=A0ABQ8UST6_9EUKA|nr:hypothetical protein PAPYR_1378 [Paratrimastix pyriformis]
MEPLRAAALELFRSAPKECQKNILIKCLSPGPEPIAYQVFFSAIQETNVIIPQMNIANLNNFTAWCALASLVQRLRVSFVSFGGAETTLIESVWTDNPLVATAERVLGPCDYCAVGEAGGSAGTCEVVLLVNPRVPDGEEDEEDEGWEQSDLSDDPLQWEVDDDQLLPPVKPSPAKIPIKVLRLIDGNPLPAELSCPLLEVVRDHFKRKEYGLEVASTSEEKGRKRSRKNSGDPKCDTFTSQFWVSTRKATAGSVRLSGMTVVVLLQQCTPSSPIPDLLGEALTAAMVSAKEVFPLVFMSPEEWKVCIAPEQKAACRKPLGAPTERCVLSISLHLSHGDGEQFIRRHQGGVPSNRGDNTGDAAEVVGGEDQRKTEPQKVQKLAWRDRLDVERTRTINAPTHQDWRPGRKGVIERNNGR